MALTPYELERQARIAQNEARMEQLGLTQTLSAMKQTRTAATLRARQERAARKAAAAAAAAAAPARPAARRRSERVQGQPAPNYNEGALDLADREVKAEAGGARDRRIVKENTTEEVYTMEHVRALGTREQEWDLFVDGYDGDGNRVYDRVRGATCHQCRQKTLGRRTRCARCASLVGQLCGDCLYMRYGEHVDEARANGGWACPHCRGLCNCSFHRSRRGWAPTGALYRRAAAQGYASVAHYLVLNNLDPGARKEALPLMPPALRAEVEAALAAVEEAAAQQEDGGALGGREGERERAACPPPPASPEPRDSEAAAGTIGPGPAADSGAEEDKAGGQEEDDPLRKRQRRARAAAAAAGGGDARAKAGKAAPAATPAPRRGLRALFAA